MNHLIKLNNDRRPLAHAITIGNFDGCHLGHQRLVRETQELADRLDLSSLAFTFDPNPRVYFQKITPSTPLFTVTQKVRAFREYGFDAVYVQKFDQDFSRTSHVEFYEELLKGKLQCRALVVGYDFAFGKGRQGDKTYLADVTAKDGIAFKAIEAETATGEVISSSRIRSLLSQSGEVRLASELLGKFYCLEGQVLEGAKLGRKLGFPTANFGQLEQLLPAHGVYAGYLWIEGETRETEPTLTCLPDGVYPAVLNIGIRPTVQPSQGPAVEAHVINQTFPDDGLYGKRVAFYFKERLRNEMKFPSLEALREQISRDITLAQDIL